MAQITSVSAERARSCTADEIGEFLQSASDPALLALLDNPHLTQTLLCRLLERQDLSAVLLERIATRNARERDCGDESAGNRGVRAALAAHIRTPRRIALKLARDLYLMDLLGISLRPSVSPEMRKVADELLLARAPRLPLGQKLVLARRGSGRVAGGLLTDGHERVVVAALENPRLAEAQVLRVLADPEIATAVPVAITAHPRWSGMPTVRMALARHPAAPLERVLPLVTTLPRRDLEELSGAAGVRAELAEVARRELDRRASRGAPET